jgi:hypothetical protein
VDGVTLLSSTNFVGQAYAGASAAVLRPLGGIGRFRTNAAFRGFFTIPTSLLVPDVIPGQNAYVQARVWDSSIGATYEEARARGGRYGASATVATPTTANLLTIPAAAPLQSFALTAGLPERATGRIEVGVRHGSDPITWNLIGGSGMRYLVEKKLPPENWVPLLVLTNFTGVVSFIDPDPANASVKFYRARLLD